MEVDDPYKALASAILMQAIKDLHKPKLHQEVREFFLSAWFEDVCVLARLDPAVVREKLHIVAAPNKACSGLAVTEAAESEGSQPANR